MASFGYIRFYELINREELRSVPHLFTYIINHEQQYYNFVRNSNSGKCDKLWPVIATVIDTRFDYTHYVEFYNYLDEDEC